MSDFKFFCPECGQKISGDARLSGSQISCPACQQNFTVSPAPMAAPALVAEPMPAAVAAHAPPPAPVRNLPPPRAATLPPPRAAAAGRPGDQSHYSGLAIASLISSVFAVFGFIPGIICGHMAKARMRKDVFLEGEKLANAGLAISYSVLAVVLILAMTGMATRLSYHPSRTVLASTEPIVPGERLVDEVKVPDTEEDHEFEGQATSTSVQGTQRGRKASHGGYFTYTMKVSPTAPMSLMCRYWGGEPKGRFFDIAIGDQVIATQKLDHDIPNKFFNVEYKIPAELTRGKTEVTVAFQARPTATAGTIYGCEMLKR